MKAIIATAILMLLTGCATEQTVMLLPRGEGQQGRGTFDQIHQLLTVELAGNTYSGTPIAQTSTSGRGAFGPTTTTTTNQQAALLTGAAGQIRCEFAWGSMRAIANGTCVDNRNVTYDLLIKN